MSENLDLLVDQIKSLSYFHSIDFGEWQTKSWVYPEDGPKNIHLFSVFHLLHSIDVNGKYCLDMGTFDGLTAFILAALGGKVVATCQFDRKQFRLAHQYLCHLDQKFTNIQYVPGFHIENAENYQFESKFDLIVVSAALHHMLSPMAAIATFRNLLKQKGLLLLEAAYIDGDQPVFSLNTEVGDPVEGIPSILIPTKSALEGALKFCSFNILGTAELNRLGKVGVSNYKRIAYVAEAVKPSQVSNRRSQLIETHERSPHISHIRFRELEEDESAKSDISYQGDRHTFIDVDNFNTSLPLQPKSN